MQYTLRRVLANSPPLVAGSTKEGPLLADVGGHKVLHAATVVLARPGQAKSVKTEAI